MRLYPNRWDLVKQIESSGRWWYESITKTENLWYA